MARAARMTTGTARVPAPRAACVEPRRSLPMRSLLFGLVLASATGAAAFAAPPPDLVLQQVRLVTLDDDTPTGPQDVVLRDGRIAAIGAPGSLELPDDAIRIDGAGRFLMPGLVEMHAHVPPLAAPHLQAVLDLFLANGVTTVRGVLGEPGQLELRSALADGSRRGPRLYTAGPSLNGNSVADAEAAVAMVEAQKAAGYDLLKLHPGLDRARFDSIAATARRVGIPIAGHVSEAVGLERALAGGTGTIEHLDDYVRALVPDDRLERSASPGFFGVEAALAADEGRIAELVRLTREADAWVVPTESLMVNLLGTDSIESLLARPEFAYVTAATREQWRKNREGLRAQAGEEKSARFLALRRALIKALYAADRVLLGADAPQMFNVPGFSLHQEMALMVEAGASPRAVLRSGTRLPARWLGAGEKRGRIAVGQDADLVLLEADPLADIANTRRIVGVVAAGRWHDRAALDALLAAAKPAPAE
jgi:imidazolonepropionase-like amidohydrolase